LSERHALDASRRAGDFDLTVDIEIGTLG